VHALCNGDANHKVGAYVDLNQPMNWASALGALCLWAASDHQKRLRGCDGSLDSTRLCLINLVLRSVMGTASESDAVKVVMNDNTS